MLNKILVAIDNSEISRQAFDEALSLAKVSNASLILFHVLSPFEDDYTKVVSLNSSSIYPTFNADFSNYYLKHWEEIKQERIDLLNKLADTARISGVDVEFSLSLGSAGKIICDKARDCGADVIVIGRRGIGLISEFLLGSVSNYVLHHAPCSVFTVQQKVNETHAIHSKEYLTSSHS
ncbi:MAG: universal stress protein [Calothrix sp. SM1_7_51]|nr:universal stress protein [Calothrix sp. SM1_7_51]